MVDNLRLLSESEFSIKLCVDGSDTNLPLSLVYVNNSATGVVIAGAILEGAVRYKDFYLVFLCNDIPYEESLHIYYFDAGLKLLDSAVLGSMYSTGHFRGLELIEPNRVKFNFFGGSDWILTLHQVRQNYFPFLTDPKGVTRSVKLHCYFKVDSQPLAEGRG